MDVLIISSDNKENLFFKEYFKDEKNIRFLASCVDIKEEILKSSYDLIVINSPLKDCDAKELAIFSAVNSTAGIIYISDKKDIEIIEKETLEYGIFSVESPIKNKEFEKAVKLILAFETRILGVKKENLRLQKKIETLQLIDRAKCTLIEYLHMTEEQAHHYIEKQAMDLRITKKEVASNILKTYEF